MAPLAKDETDERKRSMSNGIDSSQQISSGPSHSVSRCKVVHGRIRDGVRHAASVHCSVVGAHNAVQSFDRAQVPGLLRSG